MYVRNAKITTENEEKQMSAEISKGDCKFANINVAYKCL